MSWVGKTLKGFCEGFFGRDSYDDKVVEGVGDDWVVARDQAGNVLLAEFEDKTGRDICLKKWNKGPNNYGEYEEVEGED